MKGIEEKETVKIYYISTSIEKFTANGIIIHNTTEQRELEYEEFKLKNYNPHQCIKFSVAE